MIQYWGKKLRTSCMRLGVRLGRRCDTMRMAGNAWSTGGYNAKMASLRNAVLVVVRKLDSFKLYLVVVQVLEVAPLNDLAFMA